jgi:GNAT superfamily N-acetyltransferase
VSRHLRDLTITSLDDLPQPCRHCVFWEVGSAGRGSAGPSGGEAKEAWVQATQLEWGAPGKICYLDEVPVAYALFAPGSHFPRARRLGRSPSDDAVLLATLWVHPDARGSGLARVLLHAVLRETHSRGHRALEAYGVREGALPTTCVLTEGFLLANGFQVLHDDAQMPLLCIDLRQTVRLQESVTHALEGVLKVLSGRERAPAPARPGR